MNRTQGSLIRFCLVCNKFFLNKQSNKNTTVQVGKIIYVSEWRLFCFPRLHLFDKKYSKNSNIVKYYLK